MINEKDIQEALDFFDPDNWGMNICMNRGIALAAAYRKKCEEYKELLARNYRCEMALSTERDKYNRLSEVATMQNAAADGFFDAATQDQPSFNSFLDKLKIARIAQKRFEELENGKNIL